MSTLESTCGLGSSPHTFGQSKLACPCSGIIHKDVTYSRIVTALEYEGVGSARGTPPLSIYAHELFYFLQHASNNAASLARGSEGTYLGMHVPRSLPCGTLRPYCGNQCVKRYGLLVRSWRLSGGELELMSMTTRNSIVACQSGRESDLQRIMRAQGSMSKDLRLLTLDPTARRFVCNPHHTI
jgi:hypothetical protein